MKIARKKNRENFFKNNKTVQIVRNVDCNKDNSFEMNTKIWQSHAHMTNIW